MSFDLRIQSDNVSFDLCQCLCVETAGRARSRV